MSLFLKRTTKKLNILLMVKFIILVTFKGNQKMIMYETYGYSNHWCYRKNRSSYYEVGFGRGSSCNCVCAISGKIKQANNWSTRCSRRCYRRYRNSECDISI